jgi:hypothetical protein
VRLQVRGVSAFALGLVGFTSKPSTTAVGTASLTRCSRLSLNTFMKLAADDVPPGRRKFSGLDPSAPQPRGGPSGRHDMACAPANGRYRYAADFIHSGRTSRGLSKSVRLPARRVDALRRGEHNCNRPLVMLIARAIPCPAGVSPGSRVISLVCGRSLPGEGGMGQGCPFCWDIQLGPRPLIPL